MGTADVGSNDLASPLQREDKKQGLGVKSDLTMVAVESIVTQSQVANESDDDVSAQNNDADAADVFSVEQSQVANCVNEDSQNQATPFNVNVRSQLNSHEEKLSQEPTLAIKTDVSAGAIHQSSALSQPLVESGVDDPNKVTVKHLDSFDAKRLRIPKRPQKGWNDSMINRQRLDTESDNVSKSSTEKQKNRVRDVLPRQMEEDEKLKVLEAEYEAF